MTNPPIHTSIFTPADADEMARLLGQVFAERDPPAVAVGLTAAEFEALVRLYLPKAEAEGLTVVARSATTGEMVGALLAEDSGSEPPDGLDRLSDKFDPIVDLLGQLDAEPTGGIGRPLGRTVHLFLLGVAADQAGRGVAQQLVAECVDNAQRKGFRLAVTEATNRTSQHVFRKLGFEERVRRSYRDHEFGGHHYFTSIADQGGPMRMEKPLGV